MFGYAKLICELERIIARNCYNKNFNGGTYYRYPVHYIKNGKKWIAKGLANVPEESLETMYYEFGTNKVYIGKALLEVLHHLEKNFSSTEDFLFYGDDEDDY